MVDSVVWDIGYLVSAALFILGIKRLSSPRTAPQHFVRVKNNKSKQLYDEK